ncbi:hypothetical protein N0V83_006760 [Neocucurbitaria cava]|uniref:Myb-like domain-containing protein n=1 Tax=Neocucurbitaria cava TaxID=798079 RepID=A0A9W9CLJ8_9PLEO|nr:hypothetical protein N0V83_006760 [Neocucurbitaria cava]
MADDPNNPPRRRVSKAFLFGLSNKPFKDDPPPRPAQRSAFNQMVTTPGGLIEWVASDGRKGKLTGAGRQRLTEASLAKVPSEKRTVKEALSVKDKEKKAATEKSASMVGDLFGGMDLNEGAAGRDTKKKQNDGDKANTWTAEEDKKMMDWKNENPSAPWAAFAEEVNKSVDECKAHFKDIKPADWKPTGAKGKGGAGAGVNQQKSGKKDKKQNQGNNNSGKKKEEASGGEPENQWGGMDVGGGWGNDTGNNANADVGGYQGWGTNDAVWGNTNPWGIDNTINDNNGVANANWGNDNAASGGAPGAVADTWGASATTGGVPNNTNTNPVPAWNTTAAAKPASKPPSKAPAPPPHAPTTARRPLPPSPRMRRVVFPSRSTPTRPSREAT